MQKKLFLLGAAVLSLPVMAAVDPANIFSDNAVLQRDLPVPVWGTADAGENVTVEFAGQTVSGTADADGKWKVYLEPMEACAENRSMVISGKDNKVEISNLLVGDVWLCSGQSNMELPMWTNVPGFQTIDGNIRAAAGGNPMIRITTMAPYGWSSTPESGFPVSWSQLTGENAVSFSAVAFYFGHELQRELDIPIGLVASHWGGARIEPWTPPEGFDSMPSLEEISRSVNAKLPGTEEYAAFAEQMQEEAARWTKDLQEAVANGKLLPVPPALPPELVPYTDRQQPTVIYNKMVYHMIPYCFKGVLWYQGCSNIYDGAIYQDKMQALLNGWREVFERPDMPFYFVQLAPFDYGDEKPLPIIWEAQEKFAEANGPEVAMAVINDVGEVDNIHPADKETVGKRLSLLALKHTYGFDIKADSPILTGFKAENGAMILSFRNVEEWQIKDGADNDFQLAGSDGVFHPAKVTVSGTDLSVTSEHIAEPVSLRYMWSGTAEGDIFNEAGLPLGAFRCTTAE